MNLASKIVEVHRYEWGRYFMCIPGSLLIIQSSKDKYSIGLNKSAYTLKRAITVFHSLGLSS
jgi:hypothetical protein